MGRPLQHSLYTKAVCSRVANGSVFPQDLTSDTFSGIAIFNPKDEEVEVCLKMFSTGGLGKGEARVRLGRKKIVGALWRT